MRLNRLLREHRFDDFAEGERATFHAVTIEATASRSFRISSAANRRFRQREIGQDMAVAERVLKDLRI